MKHNKSSRPSPLLAAAGTSLIAIGAATGRTPVTLVGIAINALFIAGFFRS